VPETGSGLERNQSIDLSLIRINQKLTDARVNRILASFQVIDEAAGEPGIAAAPEDAAEIIIALETPAVANLSNIISELFPFKYPINSDTLSFGGILTNMWM